MTKTQVDILPAKFALSFLHADDTYRVSIRHYDNMMKYMQSLLVPIEIVRDPYLLEEVITDMNERIKEMKVKHGNTEPSQA